MRQYTGDQKYFAEYQDEEGQDIIQDRRARKIISERETDYHRRKYDRGASPSRADPFNVAEQPNGKGYADIMKVHDFEQEEEKVKRLLAGKTEGKDFRDSKAQLVKQEGDKKLQLENKAQFTRDEVINKDVSRIKRSRWDEAPTNEKSSKRSRWDQTPLKDATSLSDDGSNSTSKSSKKIVGADFSSVSRKLTDLDLDELLPSKGYTILEPPSDYLPPQNRRNTNYDSSTQDLGYNIPEQAVNSSNIAQELPTEIPGVGDLAYFKAEDMKFFGKLVDNREDAKLSLDELRDKKIMRLLLKIKNGTPPQRKSSLREITDTARQLGAGPLFNQILPLLMERSLEDQERHLLVKIIDRVMYKLDDLVRPFVHKILVVIEPLLIDEDYYARIEGREIISNLAKAAGLAHMISTMRPDIDNIDEFVRNCTARAFSVVASALGIPALLPFLKAVCRSKKSWQARHTGVRIIQQIAILMNCAILPHLKGLVDCIAKNLEDEQNKVRTMTALALSALAEAATPYGYECFDTILKPLWTGAKTHRGKTLAAFLKAVGFIIPLMNEEEEAASYYTDEVMKILKHQFDSPDEEMKKIVLKVIKQCAGTNGVTPEYLKSEVVQEFFESFWIRRMASDKRNYRQVMETTCEVAKKVGCSEVVARLVDNLKDDNEQFRRMSMETIEKVISDLGASDVSDRLEERLIDGILFAFQEQSTEDIVMLRGFSTVVNHLGIRTKPYLEQIVSTILWRLNNRSATVRQQSADLIQGIAGVMKTCEEDDLMGKLGIVLFEYLGEEYPEVLGSILGALRAIVAVVGVNQMQPPIRDLLPRLTPILRNRHEKVQENAIDLVGRIADRGAEFVNAREWMRICFELLDMLRAHKKGIRRATVNTFGFIAKGIGPQDVLATLLSNLRVQERQSRVCTCVAIAIVAEICGPFTILPAIMNDYRVPEMNVQNGVLKSMSFIFEYIGEQSKDYIYAVTPLLEDALIDRDQVHRQTAAATVKHLALGVIGLGCEDALTHLLNLVWPNIFETSPHVIDRMIEAVDAIRTAVGPGIVLYYTWAGLFHPARKVKEIYWRIYNAAYVQQADALVPYYPPVKASTLRRDELMDVSNAVFGILSLRSFYPPSSHCGELTSVESSIARTFII